MAQRLESETPPGAEPGETPSKLRSKKKMIILMLGETGSGKSTLVQSIRDFVHKTPYDKVCRSFQHILILSRSQTEIQKYRYNNKQFSTFTKWLSLLFVQPKFVQ